MTTDSVSHRKKVRTHHVPGQRIREKEEKRLLLVLIWIGTTEKRGAAGGEELNSN